MKFKIGDKVNYDSKHWRSDYKSFIGQHGMKRYYIITSMGTEWIRFEDHPYGYYSTHFVPYTDPVELPEDLFTI
jgi:hypothetical protein